MSSRLPVHALLALLLLLLIAAPHGYFGTSDTCHWLRTEAAVIAREKAGLPIELLPSEDPMFDWSFGRFVQLAEPYHSEGRRPQGCAQLRFLRPPPIVE
jgi:hypothetical protein